MPWRIGPLTMTLGDLRSRFATASIFRAIFRSLESSTGLSLRSMTAGLLFLRGLQCRLYLHWGPGHPQPNGAPR